MYLWIRRRHETRPRLRPVRRGRAKFDLHMVTDFPIPGTLGRLPLEDAGVDSGTKLTDGIVISAGKELACDA